LLCFARTLLYIGCALLCLYRCSLSKIDVSMLTGEAEIGALAESECKGTAIFGTDQMF